MASTGEAKTRAIPAAEPHVSVRVLYPFAAALRDEGADLDAVLAAARIPRESYCNPDLRVPVSVAGQFHFCAAAASRDPALGLAAARHFGLARFQILEYSAATRTDVEAALDTLVNNEGVLSDLHAIHLEPRSEGLLVRVKPPTDRLNRCWIEFAVGAIYLAGRRILGESATPGRRSVAWFAYSAPACAAEYEVFFGGPVRFDAPASGLLISSATLKQHIESADSSLNHILENHLRSLALQVMPRASFLERARVVLRESLLEGASTLDGIAAGLHMSRSTLRRRLGQEGVTHRSLLDDVRRELALGLLRQDLSIKEIAYRVGYEHQASFNRAFRRWTGVTPAERRTQMHSDSKKRITSSPMRAGRQRD